MYYKVVDNIIVEIQISIWPNWYSSYWRYVDRNIGRIVIFYKFHYFSSMRG